MKKACTLPALVALLLLGPGAALVGAPERSKDAPPERPLAAGKNLLPKDAVAARKALAEWVKTFLGKTQGQLEKEIGPATRKGTYVNLGKEEMVLRYETPDQDTIGFYFVGDRIITVSYHLLVAP